MANPRTDPKKPPLPEALQGALNRMFFSVVAVDPVRDTVSILLNRENPAQAGQTLSWSAYTARYAPVLTGTATPCSRSASPARPCWGPPAGGSGRSSRTCPTSREGGPAGSPCPPP